MAKNLPLEKCPRCNATMETTSIPKKESDSLTANTYEDCIRKCLNCRIGASNSYKKPTFIWEDIYSAIPSQLHSHLETTLSSSLNQLNKAEKRRRFGYSTSEDAFTWIFIRYFIENHKIDILQDIFEIKDTIEEILLWGVPQININSVDFFKKKFEEVCNSYKEKKGGYSEPDLVIISQTEVFFIEVKLASKNVIVKNDNDIPKFEPYLREEEYYSDTNKVKQSKLYELVRNWSIGKSFSEGEGKSFTLVNLGPSSLFTSDKDLKIDLKIDYLQLFEDSLNGGHFKRMEWQSILSKLSDQEDWWLKEIQDRFEGYGRTSTK